MSSPISAIASVSVQVLEGPLASAVGQILAPFAGQAMQQLQGVMSELQSAVSGLGQGFGGGAISQQPPAFSSSCTMSSALDSLSQGPQHFNKAPLVGADSQWPTFSQSVNDRITGSSSSKAGLFDGSNPWAKQDGRTGERAAVGWTMQQNDTLKYDSDRKMFYTTGADGSKTDAISLDQVMQTINANGGANPSNGAAFNAVGNLVNHLPQGAPPPDFSQLINILQKAMQALSSLLGGKSAGSALNGPSANPQSGSTSGPFGPQAGAQSSSGANAGGGTASASGPSSFSNSSGIDSMDQMVNSVGPKIDSMMDQANQLMSSDKPSDQLKGQMMMQKAMRMFEMISKMMEQRSQMASKAIQAIK